MIKNIFSFIALTLFAVNVNAQNNKLPVKLATTATLKTTAGSTAQANGIKCNELKISLDTAIKVNPKYAYVSVDFDAITGTTQAELVEGTNTVWIFDKNGKEVMVKEKFLKKINAAMGTNVAAMLIKIPYRLKTDKNKYTVHYKWESKDKRKNLDLLTIQ
jgi:hypothetical protein